MATYSPVESTSDTRMSKDVRFHRSVRGGGGTAYHEPQQCTVAPDPHVDVNWEICHERDEGTI